MCSIEWKYESECQCSNKISKFNHLIFYFILQTVSTYTGILKKKSPFLFSHLKKEFAINDCSARPNKTFGLDIEISFSSSMLDYFNKK